MRIIKDYPHPIYKVSIFKSEGKFHVKIAERGLELRYTLTEEQCENLGKVEEWIEQEVIEKSARIFPEMNEIAISALKALDEEEDSREIDII